MPFVQDGTRDGETVRTTMTTQFEEALTSGQRPRAAPVTESTMAKMFDLAGSLRQA